MLFKYPEGNNLSDESLGPFDLWPYRSLNRIDCFAMRGPAGSP